MELTTQAIRQLAAGALLRELELRVGSEVAVRVVAAPPQGGQGAISLAGQLLRAQLPPGLAPDQKLAVQVARGEGNEVVLKVLHEPQQGSEQRGEVARTAGALAVSGDPKLVQVAAQLQQPGLALPLPNGDALALQVYPDGDDEADGEQREAGGEGEAAFVLHSAALGAIEVRLRLGGGVLGVGVVVEPRAAADARAALPELTAALARATRATPVVEVAARKTAPPPAPRVEESLDAYA
jgi:hypothetical protein